MIFERFEPKDWSAALLVQADQEEESGNLPLAESFRVWAGYFTKEVLSQRSWTWVLRDVFGFYSPLADIPLNRGNPYTCDCRSEPHYPPCKHS